MARDVHRGIRAGWLAGGVTGHSHGIYIGGGHPIKQFILKDSYVGRVGGGVNEEMTHSIHSKTRSYPYHPQAYAHLLSVVCHLFSTSSSRTFTFSCAFLSSPHPAHLLSAVVTFSLSLRGLVTITFPSISLSPRSEFSFASPSSSWVPLIFVLHSS